MNFFTHQEVMQALSLGLAEAEKRGVSVGISILDEGNNLVGCIVMEGREVWLAEDSRGKAMATVAMMGRPSGEMQERASNPWYGWVNNQYGGRLNYMKGGVPIFRDGKLIGAAGAGGAPLDDDEAIAWVVSHALGDH